MQQSAKCCARSEPAPTYVTIDIDGIDPAWAPGTGVPEIGGLSPRDVQLIVRALRGKHLVGGDICEVTPGLDPTGITAVTAANLMWEMLCVFAEEPSEASVLVVQSLHPPERRAPETRAPKPARRLPARRIRAAPLIPGPPPLKKISNKTCSNIPVSTSIRMV